MKSKILILLLVAAVAINAQSQWNTTVTGQITTNDKVGLGIASPVTQLHIASNSDHAFSITRTNGLYGFRIFRDATYGRVFFQNTDDSNNWGTRIQIEEGGSNWQNLVLNPNGGRVGIGTSSPSSKLNIIGDASGSNGIIDIGASGSNTNLKMGLNVDYAWIQSYGSRPLYINDIGNNTILNNQYGNVGIGTNNPTQKLTVKGTVYSTEVKVDLSAGSGPDYVFEPNYKLLSLEEIKSYIEKNKHLPEVPSAKEMETNGVNVSEMNMLLLKKIEELTLYQIDALKQIESLKQEIFELKSKIK